MKTAYSSYSYSAIVPEERALSKAQCYHIINKIAANRFKFSWGEGTLLSMPVVAQSFTVVCNVNITTFLLLFRLCKAVDDKLAALLEDAQYFILDAQKNKNAELSKRTSASRISDLSFLTGNMAVTYESDPFDRFGDSRQIQSFLQETCFSALNQ